jgi:hypothetical protein
VSVAGAFPEPLHPTATSDIRTIIAIAFRIDMITPDWKGRLRPDHQKKVTQL